MTIPFTHEGASGVLRLGLCLTLALSSASVVAAGHWQDLAGQIIAQIDRAEALYDGEQPKEAGRAVVRAYFGMFEDQKMEAALRTQLGTRHTYGVEQGFSALRKAIRAHAEPARVRLLAQEVRTAITRDAKDLDAAGVSSQVFEVNQ